LVEKKLMVFAPHPDDETLVCGGTIAKKVLQGYVAKVVVMTDGSRAFSIVFGNECELTFQQVKEIRQKESIRAMEILGIPRKNIIFLDFEDQKLGENEKPAEEIITKMLANYCPDEIFLPYEKDLHRDHKATFRIVTSSMGVLGFKKLAYQYVNKQKYDLVYSGLDRLRNLWKYNLIREDISGVLAIKKKAINEYKSQIGLAFSNQTRPLMLNPERFLKPKETFLVEKYKL